MGTGYTRNDVSNNIADGNIINASDLDGEFDAVESAFNSSTGHTHDGTAAEGGAITVVGPVQDLVVSATEVKPKTTNTLDLGTSALLYKDAYLQGNMYFRDTALKIVSSADGQLDIDADVELEVVAPTVDIDASTAVTIDTATLTITGSANVVGDLDIDNININGNTIISTDTNGNIALTPNGTGEVDISKVDIDSGAIDGVTLGTNSAVTEAQVDNININGNTISSTDTNGNINLSPNGTGVVALSSTDLTFGDNDKAIFGAGSDLQIYHNGVSASYITDQGTGNLVLGGDSAIILQNSAHNANMIDAYNGGRVGLYHANSLKLATTATGVDVTGTVTADDKVNIDASNNSRLNIKETTSTDQNTQFLQSSGDLLIRTLNDAETVATSRIALDHATGDISFYDNTGVTQGFFWDASTQRLGLGTTSPSQKLTIGSSSIAAGTGLFQQIQTAGNNMYVGIGSNNSAYIQANGEFRIATGGYADRVTVTSGGSLLVGTTSAVISGTTFGLEVKNALPAVFMADATFTSLTYGGVNFYRPANAAGNGNGISFGLNNSSSAYAEYGYIGAVIEDNTAAAQDGSLLFATTLNNSRTERLRIDSSGNVGIGTSSPFSASQILNTGWSSGAPYGTVLTVTGNNTNDANWGHLLISDSTTTTGNGGSLRFAVGATDSDLSPHAGIDGYTEGANYGGLKFLTRPNGGTSTERMRIDSSGNVGIGTTSPSTYGQLAVYKSSGDVEAAVVTGSANYATYRVQNNTRRYSMQIRTDQSNAFVIRDETASANRMLIDTSGNLLVGKTSTAISTVGFRVDGANGFATITRDGYESLILNRKTSDGDIAKFQKDGTTVGTIGTGGADMYFANNSGMGIYLESSGTDALCPCDSNGNLSDNSKDIGQLSYRWDDIYATNGTIQTSDANEKQQIAALTDAEMTAAKAISALFKTFKWNSAVEAKGDAARTHAGVIAQDVQAAMTAAGLDAGDYAFFISSTWYVDADGNEVEADAEGAIEKNRKGIRYPELLAFVGAATEQRLANIETRLAALEAN